MNKRNRYSGIFKARVSLEAIKGEKTLAELSSKYQVHANQITTWKKINLYNAYFCLDKWVHRTFHDLLLLAGNNQNN